VDDLLAAAGPLRDAYAAVDWATSPVGDPGGWDESLRSTLRVVLGTRFPVTLFWGDDLVLLYNEAYVDLIADKHPGALGRPAREVFPEAWDVIGPLFDEVRRTGEATWSEDQRLLLQRHEGPADETFFTFSYSAVRDAAGEVLGVLDIAVETTHQVVDRRRLELLTQLNLALADILDPADLADRALPVLRSAPLDLAAVDVVDDPSWSTALPPVGEPDERAVPRDERLPAPPGDVPPAGVALQETEAGAVVWVRLPASRPGIRRPLLGVLLGPTTRLDEGYRGFLGLVAASLAAALDRAHAHAVEQAAADVTRQMSEALQRSMLTELPQPDHLELHARYLPAVDTAQVGGDWYDAVVLPDGATALVIGDVVGHDSRAAAAMGQVRAMTRTLAWASPEPPSDVLARVDRAMADLHASTLATVLLARVEQTPEDEAEGLRRLRWSSAGHLPPVLLLADGTTELLPQRSDLLLGVDPTTRRTDQEVVLPPGSTVLLYTDGLVERRDQPLTATLELMRTAVARLADLPLAELVDEVIRVMTGAVRRGRAADEHDDDVAVLAVRLHPEDRPRPPEAGPNRL
jgi:serine phosphatase RsbU (regulator of sigma subunit)